MSGARRRLAYYDDAAAVGRRIRGARLAAGMSQRDLAFPGCTAAYISRIENGERVPSLQILREFARRLGVGEVFLARGEESEVQLSPFVAARAALRVGELAEARTLVAEATARAVDDRERGLSCALEGEIALLEGDAAAAIAALERAVELDPELVRRDVSVADALGRAYARANLYESAIATFQRSYEAATAHGDRVNRVRFGAHLANAYSDTGDFSRAEALLGELIVEGADLADPLIRARVYWSQSRMHARKREGDAAAHYAGLALDVLEHSDQSYFGALAHLLLAHIELDRGNAERALELLDEADPLVSASGRPNEKVNLLLERARALALLGRADDAISLAAEATPLLEQASTLDAGRGYALMGKIYAILGNDARAVDLYEQAIEKLEEAPTRYLVDAYSELAALYERDGQTDRVVELLRRAVDIQRTRVPA